MMLPAPLAPASLGSKTKGSFLLLLSSVLFLSFFGCTPSSVSDPTAGPEPLVEEWVAMWNSYDLDQVEELFLADDRLTYFSSEREGVIHGMEAVLEHHRGFGFVSGGAAKGTRLWLEDLTVQRFPDMAVVTGIWFFEGEGEMDTEAEPDPPQRGPVTIVCLEEAGRWWFVHMNFSTYLPPDPEVEGS